MNSRRDEEEGKKTTHTQTHMQTHTQTDTQTDTQTHTKKSTGESRHIEDKRCPQECILPGRKQGLWAVDKYKLSSSLPAGPIRFLPSLRPAEHSAS